MELIKAPTQAAAEAPAGRACRIDSKTANAKECEDEVKTCLAKADKGHLEVKVEKTEIKEFEEQLPNLKGDAELEVKEKISILQQENEGYVEEINRYNAWHSDIEYRRGNLQSQSNENSSAANDAPSAAQHNVARNPVGDNSDPNSSDE